MRTSLALVGFGLTLLQLHPGRGRALGLGALGAAAVFMLVGYGRFRYHQRQLEQCRLPG